MICKLALEDGTVFTGQSTGAPGTVTGEVVFNTAMAGYQEVLTDPSYCGQIVAMTSSMIGNYGVNDTDQESRRTFLSGFVVREMVKQHSNWRATGDLPAYLNDNGVVAVTGVDTRALTRRLRVLGSLRGALSTKITDDRELIALARATPSMAGHKLADRVTRDEPCGWDERLPGNGDTTAHQTAAALHVAVIDTGAKSNILRHLASRGCRTRIVPCTAPAEAILESKPDGVLVCNGPGDPEPVVDTIAALRSIIGRVPLFGICLGHQLISLALGAKTHKLKFGHHGVNHPVMNLATGRVEITSQNHGFAVTEESLPGAGAVVTHRSLNDRSVEGFAHASDPIFAVQYHPEAAPGPHDSTYLFDGFIEMMQSGQV
ncbi:MAG: glutamine-hydrolyzing carbamoyl-phosphate synthase small subunit, partial [Phycisphaerales bacterium]